MISNCSLARRFQLKEDTLRTHMRASRVPEVILDKSLWTKINQKLDSERHIFYAKAMKVSYKENIL